MAPLARSEMNVLKLERYPLRILLPEREIRRRGVGRGGDTRIELGSLVTSALAISN